MGPKTEHHGCSTHAEHRSRLAATGLMETLIYIIVAVSSLVTISFVVHMFLGGLVSARIEYSVMALVLVVWISMLGAMAWDIIRRRRHR